MKSIEFNWLNDVCICIVYIYKINFDWKPFRIHPVHQDGMELILAQWGPCRRRWRWWFRWRTFSHDTKRSDGLHRNGVMVPWIIIIFINIIIMANCSNGKIVLFDRIKFPRRCATTIIIIITNSQLKTENLLNMLMKIMMVSAVLNEPGLYNIYDVYMYAYKYEPNGINLYIQCAHMKSIDSLQKANLNEYVLFTCGYYIYIFIYIHDNQYVLM